MRTGAAVLLAALFLLPYPATAQIVTGFPAGDTLQLDLSAAVHLVGLLAPPPTIFDSRAILSQIVPNGQPVTLTNAQVDPTGQRWAGVTRIDGTDIGGLLAAAGGARVYPRAGDDPAALQKLLKLEDIARQARRGLWANPIFAVRDPDHAAQLTDGYGIVAGRVLAANGVKGRIYLNFGSDYKTDFTVQLAKAAAAQLQLLRKINWLDLAHHTVRVRGWVETRGGPMVTVTDASQLELIE